MPRRAPWSDDLINTFCSLVAGPPGLAPASQVLRASFTMKTFFKSAAFPKTPASLDLARGKVSWNWEQTLAPDLT